MRVCKNVACGKACRGKFCYKCKAIVTKMVNDFVSLGVPRRIASARVAALLGIR